MYSTRRRRVYRISSIGTVVLVGWFALVTCTGFGGTGQNVSYAKPAEGFAADRFPTWVISPTNAVVNPSAIPDPQTLILPTTPPITVSNIPLVPWDTLYAKPGSVLQDVASGTYRMWYESQTYISRTVLVAGVPVTTVGPTASAIGVAFSLDGVTWNKPISSTAVFAASGKASYSSSSCPGDVFSAWDAAYVGSPRVVYDGLRYRMFYVGSDIGLRFNGTQRASIGIADSLDGITWCRAGRTTPILAPNPGSFDSLYVEPAGARIEADQIKLYYTCASSDLIPHTAFAKAGGFAGTPTSSARLSRSDRVVKVNGNSDKIKGAYAYNIDGTLFFWFASGTTGSYLIYQAYGDSDLDFVLDPENNIVKAVPGSPNENVAQSDVAGVIATPPRTGTLDVLSAVMFFTGESSSDLVPRAFRAVSPVPVPTTPGAPVPLTQVILPTSASKTPTPSPGIPALPPGVALGGPGSFFTPTPADGNYPPFFDLWKRVDEPVRAGIANRSWTYSGLPYGFRFLRERYEEGTRLVLYHDKGRMESTPGGGITNGLLAKELISGLMQVGDNRFEPRTSANEAIAGDPIELNPSNPAYYSLVPVASLYNDKRAPDRTGQSVIETISRLGQVGVDNGTGGYGVSYGFFEQKLGHNIASVFWNYFQQTGPVYSGGSYVNGPVFDWLSTVGLPLTEPYWTKATVGGRQLDVMVQAFERRVLTFTPANNDPFKVEMGNVGRHYFRWRYNLNQ